MLGLVEVQVVVTVLTSQGEVGLGSRQGQEDETQLGIIFTSVWS